MPSYPAADGIIYARSVVASKLGASVHVDMQPALYDDYLPAQCFVHSHLKRRRLCNSVGHSAQEAATATSYCQSNFERAATSAALHAAAVGALADAYRTTMRSSAWSAEGDALKHGHASLCAVLQRLATEGAEDMARVRARRRYPGGGAGGQGVCPSSWRTAGDGQGELKAHTWQSRRGEFSVLHQLTHAHPRVKIGMILTRYCPPCARVQCRSALADARRSTEAAAASVQEVRRPWSMQCVDQPDPLHACMWRTRTHACD